MTRRCAILCSLALVAAACGHGRATPASAGATGNAASAVEGSDAEAKPQPPPDPRQESRESWPVNCRDLKQALDPARAALKARPLPPRSGRDPWALRFGELAASLPAGRYTLTLNVSPRSVSAVLISPALSLVLIEDPPAEPVTDVFARVGGQRNPASEELTRELFGKAPTVFELLRRGYAHTLDDLTCEADRMTAEIPVAIGLVLKTTGAWADAVYAEPFGQRGFTLTGTQGRHCVVETQLFSPQATRIVSYRGKRTQRCRQRLRRFSLDAPGAPRGPRWLALLGEALARPRDRAGWEALRAELRRSKAPAASITAVDRVLAPLAGP